MDAAARPEQLHDVILCIRAQRQSRNRQKREEKGNDDESDGRSSQAERGPDTFQSESSYLALLCCGLMPRRAWPTGGMKVGCAKARLVVRTDVVAAALEHRAYYIMFLQWKCMHALLAATFRTRGQCAV